MEFVPQKERGQVLVLVVIGIVGLLGFAALVIDGGMYYSDRRYDQNAADNAALSGAGAAAMSLSAANVSKDNFECGSAKVLDAIAEAYAAAEASASASGFMIAGDRDISDGQGAVVSCADSGSQKHLDVQVWLSSTTTTTLAHLVFAGRLHNKVQTIVRLEPGELGPFAAGYTILAMRHECTNKLGGITVDGNVDLTVETGKIYSNACIDANGASGEVEAQDGTFYNTELDDKHNIFDPPAEEVNATVDLKISPLDATCDALPPGQVTNCGAGKKCMTHGRYSSYKNTVGADLVLEPGLYCFTGEFESNNGSVTIDPVYNDDEGVTFYLYTSGSFSVLGNSINDLRAPHKNAVTALTNKAVPGLLILMNEGNTNQVDFGGGAGSSFRGTMFAPDGKIDFGGGSAMNGAQAVQVIADTIILHGNPGVTVIYEDKDLFEDSESPFLGLYK